MTPRISLPLCQIVLPKAGADEYVLCVKQASSCPLDEVQSQNEDLEMGLGECVWMQAHLYVCEVVRGAEVSVFLHLEGTAASPSLRMRHLVDCVWRRRRYRLHA